MTVHDAEGEADLRNLLDSLPRMITEKARMEGHEPTEVTDTRDRAVKDSIEKLDQLMYSIIENRRQNPQENKQDVLSILLRRYAGQASARPSDDDFPGRS